MTYAAEPPGAEASPENGDEMTWTVTRVVDTRWRKKEKYGRTLWSLPSMDNKKYHSTGRTYEFITNSFLIS